MSEFKLQEPTIVPSGIPGIDLVHMPEWFTESQLPSDGHWSVTLSERNVAMQRCQIGFRSLHAAAHYALRIRDMADWSLSFAELSERMKGDAELSKAMRHAEAHAHEIDAAWPANSWMPFSNGPSILDDSGETHKFIAQAPYLEWTKDDEGKRICSECGMPPVVNYEGDE